MEMWSNYLDFLLESIYLSSMQYIKKYFNTIFFFGGVLIQYLMIVFNMNQRINKK